MFGGVATGLTHGPECSRVQPRVPKEAARDNRLRNLQTRAQEQARSQPQELSGLWQWRDSGTTFYQ